MDKGTIRDIAKSVTDRPRSEATEAQYRRAWAMLDGEHWADYAQRQGYARRSAYRLKAAWQYGAAHQALELLKEADRAAREGDKEAAREARGEAAELAAEIRDGADYERQNRLEDGREAAYQGEHPRRGKRGSLRGLPDGWQRDLVQACENRDKIPTWVMALSGARPAELARGVRVQAVEGGVRFRVEGAKTGQGYGQEWREFTVRGPESASLADWVHEHFGDDPILVGVPEHGEKDPLGAFQKRLSRTAQRTGMAGVSAYSLRHQVAASWKASGVALADMAGALGHSVDATQSMYGHPAQGRGSVSLEDVETAQEVRHTAVPAPEPDDGPVLR